MKPAYVLAIRDANDRVLTVDVAPILDAIGDLSAWRFAILDFDGTGEINEVYDELRAKASGGPVWVPGSELRELATKIQQTIDAQIAAYPADLDREALTPADLDVARFPANRMSFVIAAVDSTVFEVYAKDEALLDRIAARFRDTRREDPTNYF
ncbi:MAG: hypothetical protein AB7T06_21240 [Kofleriaceae bacterium]